MAQLAKSFPIVLDKWKQYCAQNKHDLFSFFAQQNLNVSLDLRQQREMYTILKEYVDYDFKKSLKCIVNKEEQSDLLVLAMESRGLFDEGHYYNQLDESQQQAVAKLYENDDGRHAVLSAFKQMLEATTQDDDSDGLSTRESFDSQEEVYEEIPL